MSFFTSNRADVCPGPIHGNPLNGLCERVCIETTKVFDSCIKQVQEKGLQAVVTNQTPPSPNEPLTFTGCGSVGEPATISNLTIERFEDRPNFARVSCDVNIPIEITYVDDDGVEGKGDSIITVAQDVILYVPQPSIIPFNITAFGSCVCTDGEYLGDDTFSIDVCITVILKVVADVDLLIPTYGFCQIPPCQEFSQEACAGFFELPLYPEPDLNAN
jgi:hypothetical protein